MINTGHAFFAREAAKQKSIKYIVTNYYDLVESGELSHYPHSTKPPGQLVFYMLTERAARTWPFSPEQDAFQRMTTFATFTYPLLTYLVLIPLLYVSKLFMSNENVIASLVLYLFVPNIILITLHLDQCLYPLLFLTPVCLFIYGLIQERAYLLLLSGIATYIALFVSFSLITIVPVLCIFMAFLLFRPLAVQDDQAIRSIDNKTKIVSAAKSFGLFSVGLILMHVIFLILFDYDALYGYSWAMSNHQEWKIEHWNWNTVLYVGCWDIIEYVIWTGIPLSLLFVTDVINSLLQVRKRNLNYSNIVSILLFIILVLLAFAGKTVAETARLWIFLAPLFVISASSGLALLFREKQATGLSLVVILQLITTLMIKIYHDFH